MRTWALYYKIVNGKVKFCERGSNNWVDESMVYYVWADFDRRPKYLSEIRITPTLQREEAYV